MAKVVLVWNEHPTEVVAGFHARKVAKILKEKYGHAVILHKIPYSNTLQGRWIREAEASMTPTREWTREKGIYEPGLPREHGAQIFNFHSSPWQIFGGAYFTKPENFKIVEKKRLPSILLRGAIMFHRRDTQQWIVEVPAKAELQSPKRRKKLKKAVKWVDIHGASQVVYHRLLKVDRLSKQQKYLHPAISEKIAAAIHERITRRK